MKNNMYQVFQDNIPADGAHFNLKKPEWQKSIFNEKRDAEVYAYIWAYDVSIEDAKKYAPNMEINKDYNFSTCEFPIYMKIKKI